MKKWISSSIKHPGALTTAASRNGRSKKEEAEVESHSDNPHVRGRGILGLRLMGGDLHKDEKKAKSKGSGLGKMAEKG